LASATNRLDTFIEDSSGPHIHLLVLTIDSLSSFV